VGTLQIMASLRCSGLFFAICAAFAATPCVVQAQNTAATPSTSAPTAPENAWKYLLEAKAAHTPAKDSAAKPSPEAQRALVEANKAVFPLVSWALQHPLRFPPGDGAEWFPMFTSLREIARLYGVRVRVQVLEGDLKGAVGSVLDTVSLGLKLQEDGPLMSSLVGLAIEGIGRKSLEDVVPQLSAPLLAEAARGLHEREGNRPTFAAALRGEATSSEPLLKRMLEDFDQPEMLEQWRAAVARDDELYAQPFPLLQSLAPASPEEEAPTEERDVQGPPPNLNDAAVQRAWIEALIKPTRHVKRQTAFLRAPSQTDSALLQTALALRSYRIERGAWPASLQVLAPGASP
jgi:hypothetical protein